jgi:5'(3')-deoxyribonucleotidase
LLANPEYTLNLPLIDGSQNGMKQLTDHEVFVVTARRPNAEAATKQWLQRQKNVSKKRFILIEYAYYKSLIDVDLPDMWELL